ncbi:MAG: hypothetical protein JWN44_6995 [Myxococcales bacterium]|nr:hypothetical protein [Myxococcales bacterium]
MFSAVNRVGRLLEIRVTSPFNQTDAMALFKEIYRAMPRKKGLALVFADLRGLRVVDPEVVDMVTGFMRLDNPYVERNAFLLAEHSALLSIQGERMLKQTGASSRRNFRLRAEAESWMSEVLSSEERTRMIAFLNEYVPH